MKCIQKSLGILSPKYPIENLCIPNQTLFIDIETTGLYVRSSNLYMIGCAYLEESTDEPACWHFIQWLATNYEDEVNVLNAFAVFAKSYRYLIHFNGNQFDIPYLQNKLQQYNINFNFDNLEGIDIYRRIAPYKAFLKLPNCKQKTIEQFITNTVREDQYTGGELIDIYHEYVLNRDEEKEHFLLLHNEEDVKGMLEIIAALAVPDLFHLPIKVTKVQANHYKDVNQNQCSEIIMNLLLPTALPTEISYGVNNCYFTGCGEEGKLRVPIYEGELKYFYANYKDYYYLPQEDTAIHKSVASFVDKDYRKQATARTCYTRKISSYLPQWDTLFTPFFKKDYDDKNLFFELTDELKTQRNAFNLYAHHVLEMMI
ncbi:MAG: ribonuclease H-like domain-containing protein [Lachnospiraceae bacterium]|nr:ribonuclease H-like domain-containing protein [Lachnospiraceae bacterium]